MANKFLEKKMKQKEQAIEGIYQSGSNERYEKLWGKTDVNVKEINVDYIDFFKFKDGSHQKIRKDDVERTKAAIIADNGIKSPLLIRKTENGEYEVISGHHRLTAARELEYKTVPCIVENISYEEACLLLMDMNVQRVSRPTDIGESCNRMIEMKKDLDLTVDDIAKKFGYNRTTIYRFINITKCIPSIQELFDNHQIEIKCVDLLVKEPKEKQIEIANMFASGELTSLNVATLNKILNGKKEEVDKIVPRFKNKIYQRVYEQMPDKFNDISEKDLESLTESLLIEHFSK